MSFNRPTFNTDNIQSLPDEPTITPSALKKKFDDGTIDIKAYLEDLIDQLESNTAGADGASNIGYNGLVPSSQNIKDALDIIYQAGSGTIPPDNSITNAKLADDIKVGSLADLETTVKGNVVGAINEVKNAKADSMLLTPETQIITGATNVDEAIANVSKAENSSYIAFASNVNVDSIDAAFGKGNISDIYNLGNQLIRYSRFKGESLTFPTLGTRQNLEEIKDSFSDNDNLNEVLQSDALITLIGSNEFASEYTNFPAAGNNALVTKVLEVSETISFEFGANGFFNIKYVSLDYYPPAAPTIKVNGVDVGFSDVRIRPADNVEITAGNRKTAVMFCVKGGPFIQSPVASGDFLNAYIYNDAQGDNKPVYYTPVASGTYKVILIMQASATDYQERNYSVSDADETVLYTRPLKNKGNGTTTYDIVERTIDISEEDIGVNILLYKASMNSYYYNSESFKVLLFSDTENIQSF